MSLVIKKRQNERESENGEYVVIVGVSSACIFRFVDFVPEHLLQIMIDFLPKAVLSVDDSFDFRI